MTNLEQLLADHTILLQKIIAEAKKEALSANSSSSGSNGTSVSTVKLDLGAQILSTFENLTKDKKDKNLASGFTMNPIKWTRNINCWAKSLDTTGFSMGIFGLGGVGGGTVITKKHVLLSNHVPYPALPFLIYFTDINNNTYKYEVVKTKRVDNTDILIGELDKEVDNNIKVYKILSRDYKKYLPSNFPILYSDQEKKALIGDLLNVYTQPDGVNLAVGQHSNTNMSQYFEMLMVGDSGNPISTIINNEIVLIGGWYKIWTSNTGLGTFLPSQIDIVNNTIASMTVGYKVTEADLSGFKMY